jgi:hypothetical protein
VVSYQSTVAVWLESQASRLACTKSNDPSKQSVGNDGFLAQSAYCSKYEEKERKALIHIRKEYVSSPYTHSCSPLPEALSNCSVSSSMLFAGPVGG